jgi:hypothetical protein
MCAMLGWVLFLGFSAGVIEVEVSAPVVAGAESGWMKVEFEALDRALEAEPAAVVALSAPEGLDAMGRFKYRMAIRRHLRRNGWDERRVRVDARPLFERAAPEGERYAGAEPALRPAR